MLRSPEEVAHNLLSRHGAGGRTQDTSWGGWLGDLGETLVLWAQRERAPGMSPRACFFLDKVPEKYSDNLQICNVLVPSKMCEISCYFENGLF